MIRFEDVSYTYPFSDAPAVRDISFRVRAGELVLVSGQSGCGKTTLMRLANGLCPGYFRGKLKGRVLVDGKDTALMPLRDVSRLVGTLFQDPEQQFFALGVEDELAFVHEWRGRSAEETRERVRRAAESFGLSSVLHNSIHELSEGQKQKVGLASILSQEPRVLVLDEPTANLDPESTADLACRLRAQGKRHGHSCGGPQAVLAGRRGRPRHRHEEGRNMRHGRLFSAGRRRAASQLRPA